MKGETMNDFIEYCKKVLNSRVLPQIVHFSRGDDWKLADGLVWERVGIEYRSRGTVAEWMGGLE